MAHGGTRQLAAQIAALRASNAALAAKIAARSAAPIPVPNGAAYKRRPANGKVQTYRSPALKALIDQRGGTPTTSGVGSVSRTVSAPAYLQVSSCQLLPSDQAPVTPWGPATACHAPTNLAMGHPYVAYCTQCRQYVRLWQDPKLPPWLLPPPKPMKPWVLGAQGNTFSPIMEKPYNAQ